jgi:hypothetical protein
MGLFCSSHRSSAQPKSTRRRIVPNLVASKGEITVPTMRELRSKYPDFYDVHTFPFAEIGAALEKNPARNAFGLRIGKLARRRAQATIAAQPAGLPTAQGQNGVSRRSQRFHNRAEANFDPHKHWLKRTVFPGKFTGVLSLTSAKKRGFRGAGGALYRVQGLLLFRRASSHKRGCSPRSDAVKAEARSWEHQLRVGKSV